jgi:hypothetical protein
MTMKPVLALLFAVSVATGCATAGDDVVTAPTASPSPSDQDTSMEVVLRPGETVLLDGYTDRGESGPRVPMQVAVESVSCTNRVPDADVDEFDRLVDMTAAAGEQLCLIQLSVTNEGDQAAWFAADLDGILRTDDGQVHRPAPAGYNPELLAEQSGLPYAASIDGVAPGETAHDFVIYPTPEGLAIDALVFDARG